MRGTRISYPAAIVRAEGIDEFDGAGQHTKHPSPARLPFVSWLAWRYSIPRLTVAQAAHGSTERTSFASVRACLACSLSPCLCSTRAEVPRRRVVRRQQKTSSLTKPRYARSPGRFTYPPPVKMLELPCLASLHVLGKLLSIFSIPTRTMTSVKGVKSLAGRSLMSIADLR